MLFNAALKINILNQQLYDTISTQPGDKDRIYGRAVAMSSNELYKCT